MLVVSVLNKQYIKYKTPVLLEYSYRNYQISIISTFQNAILIPLNVKDDFLGTIDIEFCI